MLIRAGVSPAAQRLWPSLSPFSGLGEYRIFLSHCGLGALHVVPSLIY